MGFRFFLDKDTTVNIPAVVTREDGVTVVCQYVRESKRWLKTKRVMVEGASGAGSTLAEVMEGDLVKEGLPPFPYADGAFEEKPAPKAKEAIKNDSNKDFKNLIEQAIVAKLMQLDLAELMKLRGA